MLKKLSKILNFLANTIKISNKMIDNQIEKMIMIKKMQKKKKMTKK